MSFLEDFVEKNLILLENERAAEIEETQNFHEQFGCRELQSRGVCLLHLRVGSQHSGMYGRTILEFETYWPGKELPSNKISAGDIVGVSLSKSNASSQQLASGIVTRAASSAISVAFDEAHDSLNLDESEQYMLLKLANDVTYKRIKQALQKLRCCTSGHSGHMVNVLFGISDLSPPYDSKPSDLQFFNPSLDDSQQEAVRFALQQRELAIIHGPPGTGKTTTVVEIIQQAVKQKLKILACAPSNIAVDNLVERVAKGGVRVVRLGHPARLLPGIQKHSLDAILSNSEATQLVRDVREDIDKSLNDMKKVRDKGRKQSLREDIRALKRELKTRETTAIKDVLTRSQVVLATLTSATDQGPLHIIKDTPFDLVIIDECSQALEAACWIALLKGKRCVIAGDHHQLPPTILSQQAAKDGLEVTLMERLLKRYQTSSKGTDVEITNTASKAPNGDNSTEASGSDGSKAVMRMLTTQYRMHEAIMAWSSQQFYQGRLVAHSSVAKHLLRDLADVSDTDITEVPVLLIDTAGCNLQELDTPDELSKGNEGEADLVAAHVRKLVECGLKPRDIAVIAAYNLQVELLRLRLSQDFPQLEIKSVDGFQGREKEAVVISLVRSNDSGNVGFLAESRRINVAITRARRHLAVIGDSDTISHDTFLKSLVDYIMDNGEVWSAQQYIEEGGLNVDIERPRHLQDHIDENNKQSDKSSCKTSKRMKSYAPNREATAKPKQKPVKSVKKPEQLEKEKEERRAYMLSLMKDFLSDKKETLFAFSPDLSSYERLLVHELADDLGLHHVSVGEGAERHIVLSRLPQQAQHSQDKGEKQPQASSVSAKLSALTESTHTMSTAETRDKQNGEIVKTSNENSAAEEDKQQNVISRDIGNQVKREAVVHVSPESKGPDTSNNEKCKKCGKMLPASNMQLHVLRCKIPVPQSSHSTSNRKDQPSVRPKTKKKTTKKTKDSALDMIDNDDFDGLIAAAVQENTGCAFVKCKALTATLGQNCKFCCKRFCLSHHMPEIHGCGDAAKSQARATVIREGKIYPGSGVPSKKPNAEKRSHLQYRLESKLSDMAEKRQLKKKDKK